MRHWKQAIYKIQILARMWSCGCKNTFGIIQTISSTGVVLGGARYDSSYWHLRIVGLVFSVPVRSLSAEMKISLFHQQGEYQSRFCPAIPSESSSHVSIMHGSRLQQHIFLSYTVYGISNIPCKLTSFLITGYIQRMIYHGVDGIVGSLQLSHG